MALTIPAADKPKIPASIRHKNPGAMWPGPSAKKFGAISSTVLNDGQKNKIATFPSTIDGAAAQFDLLWTYAKPGVTIGDAVAKWSGGNHTNDYLAVIEGETDLDRYDYLTRGLVEESESAIQLAKAMAKHEAGQLYPMTDADWGSAHAKFLKMLKGEKIAIEKARKLPASMPWMDTARAFVGTKEVSGKADNPTIMQFYKDAGHPEIAHDETPWCAAFACAVLERSGQANPKTLAARDFLEYGTPINEPEEGCIVVFWRNSPKSWEGHVGFVESWTASTIRVLGGNQSNKVSVASEPRSKVLGYRRPIPSVRPMTEIATDTSVQRKLVGGGATLATLLWSAWESLAGWASYAYEGVGQFVGILPETAATVTSTTASGKALAESAGMPWPMQVTMLIAVCAIAGGLYATYKRLRTVNPWAPEGSAQ